MFTDFMIYYFYSIVFLLWNYLYLPRLFDHFPCYWREVSKKWRKQAKRKSARFSCTFKCFVSCLLSIVLITCQKNSPQYRYYECTCNGCWFVFPLKRDFQPWSVAAVGECKRVSSYLVWYCFFLLYFIHSILFLLFLDMTFLSKKKRFCLMLDLYFG